MYVAHCNNNNNNNNSYAQNGVGLDSMIRQHNLCLLFYYI